MTFRARLVHLCCQDACRSGSSPFWCVSPTNPCWLRLSPPLVGTGECTVVENPLRSSRVMWGWLLAGVAGVLLLAVWAFRGRELPPGVARPAGERLTRNESVEVGGVKRPVTDIRRPESRKTTKSGESPLRHALPRLPIEKSDHPQVASVLEAVKSGSHPERRRWFRQRRLTQRRMRPTRKRTYRRANRGVCGRWLSRVGVFRGWCRWPRRCSRLSRENRCC